MHNPPLVQERYTEKEQSNNSLKLWVLIYFLMKNLIS